MQDEMLGPARAALWRAGKLDARGLLGRDGEVLSVAELARALPDDAKVMLWTGEAKYQRLVGELTPEMRAAGERLGLAEHHMVALRHYTEDGYESLNKALREGRTGLATVAADVLNEALGRLPNYGGVVVRHTRLDEVVLAGHADGAVVEYTGFTSTTRRAKDVMIKKPVRLIINSRTGHDIAIWSAAPWQEEVLFGVPKRFVVKDRWEIDGETWIWLSEVQ